MFYVEVKATAKVWQHLDNQEGEKKLLSLLCACKISIMSMLHFV